MTSPIASTSEESGPFMAVTKARNIRTPIGKSTAFHNLGDNQPPRIGNTPIVNTEIDMPTQLLAP